MEIKNPATEEVLETLEEDTLESIKHKLDAARLAQRQWRKKSVAERVAVLNKFSELMELNLDLLARTMTKEVGKPLQESINEVAAARGKVHYFVENTAKWLKSKEMYADGNTRELLSFDPLGVIANISAWNYPWLVGANIYIPALACGNAVMYKPSEYATLTGLEMKRLLVEAGLPADLFQVCLGQGHVGQFLLDLPLDGYFFTGSYKTGRFIAEQVAPRLVPVGLELGGKDPLYVTDDVADVNAAAESAVEGAFYNNGQSCCSVERIYVHEKIYEQFTGHFVETVKKLKLGDPLEPGTTIGCVTRPQHLEFLTKQVEDAVKQGARLLIGGKKREGKGSFFEPTVLVDVNHEMSVMVDETFGPVIGIQKVSNDEEAIELMKNTPYGLTSAVFSSNHKRAEKILEEMDSGTVYWNCCDRVSPHVPWSGRGYSGLGSTLSYLGILAFVKPKAHHLRTL